MWKVFRISAIFSEVLRAAMNFYAVLKTAKLPANFSKAVIFLLVRWISCVLYHLHGSSVNFSGVLWTQMICELLGSFTNLSVVFRNYRMFCEILGSFAYFLGILRNSTNSSVALQTSWVFWELLRSCHTFGHFLSFLRDLWKYRSNKVISSTLD